LGGVVFMDFKGDEPFIERISFDPSSYGLAVCIVHTGGSHADLTDEYSAITHEMRNVAHYLGEEVLGFCNPADFYTQIKLIREKLSDRAVLRAHHFFGETERARRQADALKKGDINGFLRFVNESGKSSMACLQNIYAAKTPEIQPISLALALADRLLDGRGACRVHGGGFAGTILAFVPKELYVQFDKTMSSVFGENTCCQIMIRDTGVVKVI
jgi:galactokinase